ncbi:MAG: magnesium/cobalt transporter CorA [Bacteroidia bacterium]|nr:magnesium/cobalt transporter CorA [Bacteroidia bacterium]
MSSKKINKLHRKQTHTKQRKVEPDASSSLTSNIILEMISFNEKSFLRVENIPIDDILEKCDKQSINWINVDGLADTGLINKIGQHFNLHYLLLEDVMNTDQRPKLDEYDDHIFLTMKMLYRMGGDEIDYEHISFVLGKDFLLSFQEKEGDIFNYLRERIKIDTGVFRKRGADYLLYRLVDTIVDSYYTILENVGYKVEALEENISQDPAIEDFREIQELKKEFIYLRKVVYPLREALNKLIKNESGFIEPQTLKYYSDVYDHVIHLIDSLDTYKDLTSTLMDLYMNTINYKMNEVMKLLTIITTIFIPLSFIVGIYGMNFDNLPELHWQYGYFYVLIGMGAIVGSMIFYFRYKKWF